MWVMVTGENEEVGCLWLVACGVWCMVCVCCGLWFVVCVLWFVVCVESASCAFELVSRAIPLGWATFFRLYR